MTQGDRRTLLVDASVFIALSEIGRDALLRSLDGECVVPKSVAAEIEDDPAASHLDRAEEDGWLVERAALHYIVQNERGRVALEDAASHLGHDLDADEFTDPVHRNYEGDVGILAAAMALDDAVVISDDKPLRKTCKALGIPVSGSIGVLVRAVERGDLAAADAKDALAAMDEVGARFSVSLVRRAERLIDDAAENGAT